MTYEHSSTRCARARRARGASLLVCGAGLGLTANAYDAGVRSEYVANQVINNASAVDKAWRPANGANNTTQLGRNFTMKAPGGRELAARATANVAIKDGMGIAARVLGRAVLPLAIGVTIWDVYNAVRVRPDGNGGLVADPGQADQRLLVWTTNSNYAQFGGARGMTAMAAIQAAIAQHPSESSTEPTSYASFWLHDCGPDYCRVGKSVSTNWGPPRGTTYEDFYNVTTIYANSAMADVCPPYVDSQGFQHVGGEPKLVNGKCPTGAYAPVEADAAAERLYDNMREGYVQVDMAKMWDDVLNRSPEGVPLPALATLEVNEQPPLAGPVTTTENADGTVTEVATGWNFKRIEDELGNKKLFDVTETKKTTVKDINGNVISQTQTGTSTTGATAGDAATDQCKLNPNALSCIGLGDVPDDAVPKSTRNIEWNSEGNLMPSGCPADRVLKPGLTVSYGPTCDAAQKARPFILAGAAFAALMIVLAALRGS